MFLFAALTFSAARADQLAVSPPGDLTSRENHAFVRIFHSQEVYVESADEEIRPNYAAPLGNVPPASCQEKGGFLTTSPSADSRADF